MRQLLIALAMVLFATPAFAACTIDGPASLTIVYTNAAGTVVGQKCWAIDDATMARVEAAYGSTLGPSPTVAQELLAMVDQWRTVTVEYVKGYEAGVAQRTTQPPAAPVIQ